MSKRLTNIQSLYASLINTTSESEFDKRFSTLFERLKPSLEHFFFIKCSQSKHATDDLVMMTMTRALEKLHLYDPSETQFSTWVFAIARNTMLDGIRRDRSKAHVSIDAAVQADNDDTKFSDFIQDDSPTAQEVMESEEKREHARRCLDQLSPEAKEVMVLFYLKQLKLTEICEKLHMGMSKVKVIMFRSRAKLKEIY